MPLEMSLYQPSLRHYATVARSQRSLTQSLTSHITVKLAQRLAASLRTTVSRVTVKRIFGSSPHQFQRRFCNADPDVDKISQNDYYCSLPTTHIVLLNVLQSGCG